MTGSTLGAHREKPGEAWRVQGFTKRKRTTQRERQRNWGQMVCGILILLVI